MPGPGSRAGPASVSGRGGYGNSNRRPKPLRDRSSQRGKHGKFLHQTIEISSDSSTAHSDEEDVQVARVEPGASPESGQPKLLGDRPAGGPYRFQRVLADADRRFIGVFTGRVVSHRKGLYSVRYIDDDEEDFTPAELERLLVDVTNEPPRASAAEGREVAFLGVRRVSRPASPGKPFVAFCQNVVAKGVKGKKVIIGDERDCIIGSYQTSLEAAWRHDHFIVAEKCLNVDGTLPKLNFPKVYRAWIERQVALKVFPDPGEGFYDADLSLAAAALIPVAGEEKKGRKRRRLITGGPGRGTHAASPPASPPAPLPARVRAVSRPSPPRASPPSKSQHAEVPSAPSERPTHAASLHAPPRTPSPVRSPAPPADANHAHRSTSPKPSDPAKLPVQGWADAHSVPEPWKIPSLPPRPQPPRKPFLPPQPASQQAEPYPGVTTELTGGVPSWVSMVPCRMTPTGYIHLGYFYDPESAARARDTFICINHWRDIDGRLLDLSFPDSSGRGQEYLSLPEVDPASPFCTLAPGPNGPGAANMSNGPTQLPLPVCLAAVTRGSHSSLSKLLSASYCIRLLHAWLGPVTHGCMHLLWCML